MSFPFAFWRWSPLSFDGLQMWFDAARGTTIAGGGVSQWNDLSGNNRHATQAVLANRPTLVAAQVAGLPIIRFDGVNSFLNTPLTLAQAFNANTTDITVAVVVKTTNGGGNQNVIFSNPLDDAANTALSAFAPYSPDGNTYWDSGNEGSARMASGLTWDNYAVGLFTRMATHPFNAGRVYKNNAIAFGSSVTGTFADGTSNVLLGCYTIGGVPAGLLAGDIAEIAFWNRGLTDDEIVILSRAWGAKYNIIQA